MDGRRARAQWRWAVAVVAAAVMVAGACGGGSDGGGSAAPTSDEGGTPVAVEPVGSVGEDPFTDAVSIDEVAGFPDAVSATISAVVDQAVPDETTGGVRITGDAPGLYGGTQDTQACDADQLVEFLTDEANGEKAAAFAGVLGIEAAAIADTLATFTPVVLTADTLVTNHGFRDGRATSFPAVLEAGTAVMVDGFGIPRVKCSCGNPLGEAPDDVDLSRTDGDVWDGYDPGSTVAVGPSGAPLETLTVTDTDTGDTFQQPSGAGGGGAIDVRNTVLPADSCVAEGPLTMVDGESLERSEGEGFKGGTVIGEPIEADVDGDGTMDVTFVLECFFCGFSCSSEYSIFTVRAGADDLAEVIASVPGEYYEGAQVPETLALDGEVLTVSGPAYLPSDNNADGPTGSFTSQWRFGPGGWAPA